MARRRSLGSEFQRWPLVVRTERPRTSIARQLDLPHVFEEAIARTAELCDADGSSLILVDRKTGELRFEMLSGDKTRPLRQMRLKAGPR